MISVYLLLDFHASFPCVRSPSCRQAGAAVHAYGATVVVNRREEKDAAEGQKFCFADFSIGSHERPMPSFLKMRLSTSLTMTVM